MYFSNFPPKHTPQGPIVLVLQIDGHIGLTIVRALGREGIFCLGVSYQGMAFGCHSKYLQGYAAFHPKDDYDKIEQTLQFIHLVKPHFVMAVSEPLMRQLNTCRGRLPPTTQLLFAEQDILNGAFDKRNTLEVANQLNIPTPTSYQFESVLDANKLPDDIRFPLVLKPPVPYTQEPWKRQGFKYKYCFSHDELVQTLVTFRGAPYLPLIQEYCPGHGVGIEVCMHAGEAVAAFQHERVREMPPTGGVSVMRRSAPLHQAMFADAVRLLQALNWRGVAMVEYRYDPQLDQYWLMEVNGRFWGSISLPVICGVNFPLLLLETMGFGRKPAVMLGRYPTGIYCRQLSADIHWLVTVLRMTSAQLAAELHTSKWRALIVFLRDFFRFPYHDIEWAEDLRPALHFWKERLRLST